MAAKSRHPPVEEVAHVGPVVGGVHDAVFQGEVGLPVVDHQLQGLGTHTNKGWRVEVRSTDTPAGPPAAGPEGGVVAK